MHSHRQYHIKGEGLMKEESMLKCTHCGSTLELSVGYDGCD